MSTDAKPRIAILDDYQNIALSSADWSSVTSRADITVFTDTLPFSPFASPSTQRAQRDTLIARLEPFDVICTMRERTKFPREVLGSLPNLKLLTTTGMRNLGIDSDAAKEEGILLVGTAASGKSTVEHNWLLIQAVTRNIIEAHNNTVAANPQWQTTIPTELAGKTIGFVGLGRIGADTARIAHVFNMNIIAWSPHLTQERCDAALPSLPPGSIKSVSKSTLFSTADIINICIVSSPSTRNLVSDPEFKLMKPSAFLVNISRGPIVNEDALLRVLEEGRIKGVALDVYDEEPLPLEHPLRKARGVVLTPHLGYAGDSTFKTFWGQTAENVAAYFDRDPARLKPRLMTDLDWESSRAGKA